MKDTRVDLRKVEYVFSFDAETDGLWGPVWSIAAVVLDEWGNIEDKFEGRISDLSLVKDQWVREHIIPLCTSLTPYPNARALRDAFWDFWLKWREKVIPVADCGSTVEAGLIRACVKDDLENRALLAPFPIHDLGTLLLLSGKDPQQYRTGEASNRIALAYLEGEGLNLHNPVDDAYASGRCWLRFASTIKLMVKRGL